VEGTVREVKRRVRVVASSYRAIERSVTRWIVVTMVISCSMFLVHFYMLMFYVNESRQWAYFGLG